MRQPPVCDEFNDAEGNIRVCTKLRLEMLNYTVFLFSCSD